MTPYYQDSHVTIYHGSSRSMAELEDGSVQCVVTSPPYWGLRKYEGEQEEIWGGDPGCEHEWGEPMRPANYNYEDKIIAKGWDGDKQKSVSRTRSNICQTCGAWQGAYGLEPTPEMYVEHTVEFLREIRRVLRKDGVVFWVVGDLYASQGGDLNKRKNPNANVGSNQNVWEAQAFKEGNRKPPDGLKPKDLCLIPFRVALAAQSNGWWVRSMIIWAKPNPMPESVKDRPTSSHEYILMLTKNQRYYYDADAVKEEALNEGRVVKASKSGAQNTKSRGIGDGPDGSMRTAWGFSQHDTMVNGRNLRDVWTTPTMPFPAELRKDGRQHFAVFPEKIPETCIKAATSEKGCCPKCGAPWVRVVERSKAPHTGKTDSAYEEGSKGHRVSLLRQAAREAGGEYQQDVRTVGWEPSCSCNLNPIPCTVLDPFMGSGTTLMVAKKLGRKAIGYDVSASYCDMAIERCGKQTVMELV